MNRRPIKYFTLGATLAFSMSVFLVHFSYKKNLFKDNMLEGEL